MSRWTLASWLLVVGAAGACSVEEGFPDTGYGAGQPVPATLTCMDMCARLANCAVNLCNEDTDTMNYTEFEPVLVDNCRFSCTDADVAARFSQMQWECTFMNSCRSVFGDDVCATDASYACD
jgi:hypothetical protein